MLIGYARVSPHDQTLSLQIDILTKAGCSKIYTNTVSDPQAQRKELARTLAFLQPGDTFVIWKLDRLGTSIKDLVVTMIFFAEMGIGFKSLTDAIDTTSSGGNQVFRIFRALQKVMREKTTVARQVARAKGRKGGRPRILTTSEVHELRKLYTNQTISIAQFCRKFHLTRSTFYRHVKHPDKQRGKRGQKGEVS